MNSLKSYFKNLLPRITKNFILGTFLVLGLLGGYISVKAFSEGGYGGAVVNNGDTLTAGMWNRMLHRGESTTTPWDSNNGFMIKSKGASMSGLSIYKSNTNNLLAGFYEGNAGNAGLMMNDKDGNWKYTAGAHHLRGGFIFLNNGSTNPLNTGDPTQTAFKDNCANGAVSLGVIGGGLVNCGGGLLTVRSSGFSNGYASVAVDANNNPSIELRGKTGQYPYIDFSTNDDPIVSGPSLTRDDYDARIAYEGNTDRLILASNRVEVTGRDGTAEFCLNGSCTTTLGGSSLWQINGDKIYTNYKYVGIGMQVPNAQPRELMIKGDDNADLTLESANGNLWTMSTIDSDGSWALNRDNVPGGASLLVKNNGFVGIGTTNPAAKLEVAGTILAKGQTHPGSTYIRNGAMELRTSNGELDGRLNQPYIDFYAGVNPANGGTEMSRDDFDARIVYNDGGVPGNENDSLKFYANNINIVGKDATAVLRVNGGIRSAHGCPPASVTPNSNLNRSGYTFEDDGDTGMYSCGGDNASNNHIEFKVEGETQMSIDDDYGVQVTNLSYTSDERYKKDITTINDALEKVMNLRGVYYKRIKDNKENVGLIAQEVEKIFPQVVTTDANGYKSVNYAALIGPVVESIKQIVDRANKTDDKIKDLENQINTLKQENQSIKSDLEELKKEIKLLNK